MLTIINSKHSHHLQLPLVHQLQPKPMDKVTMVIKIFLYIFMCVCEWERGGGDENLFGII